jgi:hypothetical protein
MPGMECGTMDGRLTMDKPAFSADLAFPDRYHRTAPAAALVDDHAVAGPPSLPDLQGGPSHGE